MNASGCGWQGSIEEGHGHLCRGCSAGAVAGIDARRPRHRQAAGPDVARRGGGRAPRARRAPDRPLRHAGSDGHRRAAAGRRARPRGWSSSCRGETKHYDAVVAFGRETDTYDATGETMAESAGRPSREALVAALDAVPRPFAQAAAGLLRQEDRRRPRLPPGAARDAGHARPEAGRRSRCRSSTLLGLRRRPGAPAMRVSAGFYVRSLAHDLGRRAGTGGHPGGAAPDARRRLRPGGRRDGRGRGDRAAVPPCAARLIPLVAPAPGPARRSR